MLLLKRVAGHSSAAFTLDISQVKHKAVTGNELFPEW